MPEAVIVATGRTPIGRANKGSLVDCRPDDLAALVIREVLAKVPNSTRSGRGRHPGIGPTRRRGRLQHRPGGRRAGRPARRARRDRQPLLLVVAADHPHGRPRHPGRRGRRLRGRRRRDGQPLPVRRGRRRPPQPAVRRRPRPAPRPGPRPPATPWTPLEGAFPDVYIAMGQTAENVAEFKQRDPGGAGRVRRPVPAPGRGRPGGRLLRAGDHPGDPGRRHRRHQGRRSPGRDHPRGAGRA